MNKKKILVFGYFGYKTNQLDGQTIKTRNVYSLLSRYSNYEILYVDTQLFRCEKKYIWESLKDILRCDKLVILPCLNNLKYVFPLLFLISRVMGFDIIHIGIGGWHEKYLSKWPIIRWMLGKVQINLLETTLTAQNLERKFGLKNIEIFPNFRMEDDKEFIEIKNHELLRLVFMARINIKKGLDTLAALCDMFCEKKINNSLDISIYGPIDSPQDKEYLEMEILDKYDFVKYYGALSPNTINITLRNYDVFLFPTHYFTEGFPGSILDAYRAGLPVIATNWEHASQFVHNGRNGFIVDFENPTQEMYNCIEILLQAPSKLSTMKKYALEEQKKYTSDSAWNILKKYL